MRPWLGFVHWAAKLSPDQAHARTGCHRKDIGRAFRSLFFLIEKLLTFHYIQGNPATDIITRDPVTAWQVIGQPLLPQEGKCFAGATLSA